MSKPVLPFVEMMVTQSCNISCAGCTNYSDLAHSGYLTWDQGRQQLEPWLNRIQISDFGILGGEPLMNPQIREWIKGLRTLLPQSQIRFTTNGLLLEKNFDVVDLLSEIGNCVFKISVHRDDKKLENIIQKVLDSYDWQPVVEYGVQRYKTKNNFRFQIKRPDIFWKTFQGDYHNMRPHNSDPAEALDICSQYDCPLIYEGLLYKCSSNGLLKDTLQRFGNPNLELWQPYLRAGLSSSCSDAELENFINNFGKPEDICRMCPSSKDLSSKLIHLENVSLKKIK